MMASLAANAEKLESMISEARRKTIDGEKGVTPGDQLFAELFNSPESQVKMAEWLSRDPKIDPMAPKIATATANILTRGNVIKFLVRQAQRNHIGDEDVLKHLLASIASTNSLTSAGIQPEINGSAGLGKTDCVKAVFHLLPDKWKLAGSISAKALYYHPNLPTGAIIFSDDIQWSEDLISTVKRSMGDFQAPQTHFTLDTNRRPIPHAMPARLAWWLSSVESVANDQVKDRQDSLDVDESGGHVKEVSDFIRLSRAKKKIRFSVDWRIEVARCIIDEIKSHEPFAVVIDCAEKADWKIHGDHRTQNKFWDLVEAFAILRFKQRYIDEEKWLHATVEDFNDANAVFMRRKANYQTHLTAAQTKVVKSIIALQNGVEGATQARIAENLGISYQAVQKALTSIEANTRFVVHEAGVHGIKFYRCTVGALEVAYNEGDIVTLPPAYKDPYNLVQPRYNHDTTILTTNQIDNSKTKDNSIQPIKEEQGNGEADLSKETKDLIIPKEGCKGCIAPTDSETVVVKKVVSASNQQREEVVPTTIITAEEERSSESSVSGEIDKTLNQDAHGNIEKIRALAIADFGMHGWVDPARIARGMDVSEVVRCLELLGHERYDRRDGSIGYKQGRGEFRAAGSRTD